jgi:hypothetical protein
MMARVGAMAGKRGIVSSSPPDMSGNEAAGKSGLEPLFLPILALILATMTCQFASRTSRQVCGETCDNVQLLHRDAAGL